MKCLTVTHEERMTEAVFCLGTSERNGTITVRIEAGPSALFTAGGDGAKILELVRRDFLALRPTKDYDVNLLALKRDALDPF